MSETARKQTSTRVAARAGGVLVLFSVFARVASTGKGVALARVFAEESIGELSVALLVVGIIGAVVEAGARRYVVAADELEPALGAALVCLLVSTPVGFLLLLGAGEGLSVMLEDSQRLEIYAVVGASIFALPLSLYGAPLERAYRFGAVRVVDILELVVGTAIAVGLAFAVEDKLMALAIGHTSGVFLRGLLLFLLGRRGLKLSVDKAGVRAFIAFGAPLALAAVLYHASESVDDYLLRHWWGAAALGVFTVASWIPAISIALVGLTSRVLLPWLSERKDDRAALASGFAKTNHVIAAFAAPVGAFILLMGEELVAIVYGARWSEAGPVCQLLGVALMLRGCTGYNWPSLAVVTNQTRRIGVVAALDLGLALTAGAWLVYTYGAIGAALYNVVQLGVMAPIVRFPIIWRALGTLSYLNAVWRPMLFALFAAGLASLLPSLGNALVDVLLAAMVGFAVYALLFVTLDRPGVALIRRLLSSLLPEGKEQQEEQGD